jgi:calcineurin-like phosphoesterase family protein
MFVSWATDKPTPIAFVEYGEYDESTGQAVSLHRALAGSCNEFLNEPDQPDSRKLHACWAEMLNLKPDTKYRYRVASFLYDYSDYYYFKSKRDFKADSTARFLVYGDFGIGPQVDDTIAMLIEETYNYQHDAVLHLGDLAYDLNSKNGTVGDIFFETIKPIASKIPYMVTQGNHEGPDTGCTEHYQYRLKMPGNSTNFWYSFNAGKAHFVSFSTEFSVQNQTELQDAQMAWLKQDLATYNRTSYPWLIVFGHRPMYCSADWTVQSEQSESVPYERHNADCYESAPIVEDAFEELFYEFKVDLMLYGHVHAYERFAPAYKNQSVASEYSDLHTEVNANAPIEVISGLPGQDESYAPVSKTPLPYSLVQTDEKSYGRLTIYNETALYWEQVASSDRRVLDYLTIIKSKT